MVESPPQRAWTPEEAAKLQSVFGGSCGGLTEEGLSLTLSSADSKLVIDRNQ
jgi:hypothetical protein